MATISFQNLANKPVLNAMAVAPPATVLVQNDW